MVETSRCLQYYVVVFFGRSAMETDMCACVVYVWGAGSHSTFVVMVSEQTGGGRGHSGRDSICACVKVRGPHHVWGLCLRSGVRNETRRLLG